MTSKERVYWLEFLRLYKSLPALWQIKSKAYSNRKLKAAAYEKLVQKLRVIYPEANRMMAVKKINTFRSNYRRDLKKLKEGQTRSSLWYFELLHSFLEDLDSSSHSQIFATCIKEEMSEEDEELHGFESTSFPTTTADKLRTFSPTNKPFAEPTIAASNAINEEASLSLAQSWAAQYNEMTSKQRILSRKLISDILYYGCLGHLDESHPLQLQEIMSMGGGVTLAHANVTTMMEAHKYLNNNGD